MTHLLLVVTIAVAKGANIRWKNGHLQCMLKNNEQEVVVQHGVLEDLEAGTCVVSSPTLSC